MDRRQFLKIAGGCSLVGAGCIQPTSPSAQPDVTGTNSCGDGFDRIEVSGSVDEGPIGGFELTVSKDSVPVGGRITATLENVSTAERSTAAESTGNDEKYLIERRAEEGWRSIFWQAPEETVGWTDEAVRHDSGKGFEWELTLTEGDLERGWYHVCEPIDAGEYRFVYFGIDGDRALGAEFTVTEN